MCFETSGPACTARTLEAAAREAAARGISYMVVSSNTGKTALLLAQEAARAGYSGGLVCVTHVDGFVEKGKNEMSGEARRQLEGAGFRVYTAAHALSGAERAISRKFQGAYPVEIIAHTLRIFGQGVKVCVEVSVMALDGGLLPYGTPVVAVGGTGTGADTALVLTPAHASEIFAVKVHEILCKPRLS
ncbi:MAG: hypothetical protein LBT33_03500 [Spirochaetia bacterium]|nr:hypothetical protein [Spirochaetia bacterium]